MTDIDDEKRQRVLLSDERKTRVSPAAVEAAWCQEIEERLGALDRGEAVTHDGHEVLRRVRDKLRNG